MYSLLLSTLAMMGLTFIIGFFVAGIIKAIANWADFLDFYRLLQEEILSLRKAKKSIEHAPVAELNSSRNHITRQRKLSQRLNETIHSLRPQKRITA